MRVKILPGGAMSHMGQLDGKPRELKQFCVCDRSGQTKLNLWEDKIGMVKESRCYHITNLATRRYGDKTTITSTCSTKVTEIEDVGEPDMLEACDEASDVPKIYGRVIGSDVVATYHYVICRGRQTQLNEKNEGHRCEKCKMWQKRETFRVLYSGKICIFHNEQELSLILTNSAVCMFVSEHLGGAAIDIAWKLTCAGNVELDVDSNQTVMAIKVACDDACSNQVEGSEPMLHEQRQKVQAANAQCTLGGQFEEEEDSSVG